MENQNDIELRSEELQDIIGRIPTKIEKYGILVMFCIIAMLLIGSFFFRYPDSLEATAVITNSTPPVNIVAKTTGILEYVNTKNKSTVMAGEALGVIKNTARYEDVSRLKAVVNQWNSGNLELASLIEWMWQNELQLGELHNVYTTFRSSAENLLHYRRQNYYPQKIATMQKRMESRHEMEEKEHQQHHLYEEQEQIVKDVFLRDSVLFATGMLSKEDYEKSKYSYSQSRQGPINREIDHHQHKIQDLSDKETLLDLNNQFFLNTNQYEQNLRTSLLSLFETIEQWEHNYLLKSPIDGVLNLTGVWGENQYVASGDAVFVVVPTNLKQPIGRALLPAAGAGKVKVGQRVIISINNFPEEEYGNLVGNVSAMSSTPTADGNYMVDIAFPDGLKTIFKKELPPSQQLLGTARIIVQNRRLSDLFIQPIKKILKSQEVLENE